jgi:hypothetical protein
MTVPLSNDDQPLLNTRYQRNVDEINDILDANDIDRLRELIFTEDGLVNKEIRQRAWPLLIGLDPFLDMYLKETIKQHVSNDIVHKDAEQVLKDVERSFIYLNSYNYNDTENENEIKLLKKRLNTLILRILNVIPGINYYQGYHDIASIVILTFADDDEAFKFLYILTLRYLRDHMMNGIDPTMNQLDLIPELIGRLDNDLYEIIKPLKSVYAISSIISIFTHDITNFNNVSVIWDFILRFDDPQMIIYIFVSLMIYYKDDIFMDLNEMSDSTVNSKDTSYDLDIVHVVLSKFIRTHLNISSLDSKLEIFNVLKMAINIKKKIPLTKLKYFNKISQFSFLKSKSTSLTILSLQIEEYRKYERKQRKRNETIKKLQKSNLIIKRNFSKVPMIIKVSIGFGIIAIILHTTIKSSTIRLGIGIGRGDISKMMGAFWNCFKQKLQ